MEAPRQPEPATTLAELITLSEAVDWEGCDVRHFSRASSEKLVSLGKAEKYKNDTDNEKTRVDGIFTMYKTAISRGVQSRTEWIKGLDPADVRKAGLPVHLPVRVSQLVGCPGQGN